MADCSNGATPHWAPPCVVSRSSRDTGSIYHSPMRPTKFHHVDSMIQQAQVDSPLALQWLSKMTRHAALLRTCKTNDVVRKCCWIDLT